MLRFQRLIVSITVAVALVAPATACAQGSVRIQQSDGHIKMYASVALRLQGDTLQIISRDRVGTLAVKDAACTFLGGLRRCYPYQFVLTQHGRHVIALRHGTLYFNVTSRRIHLPHSTKIVPPRSVLAFLETQRGTYISISGKLDEVKP